MELMPISAVWDLVFPIHMSTIVQNQHKKMGIPDLLLEVNGPGHDAALWIMEVAFSQTEDCLMKKIRGFATECKSVQVITIIDVCESPPYRRPKDIVLEVEMEGRDVLSLREWKVASDNPIFGSVISSVPHPWTRPLTIKAKTWLRHPDGEFYLDETNSSSYYACAVSPYYSFYY